MVPRPSLVDVDGFVLIANVRPAAITAAAPANSAVFPLVMLFSSLSIPDLGGEALCCGRSS
jgi:hypothetical protein